MKDQLKFVKNIEQSWVSILDLVYMRMATKAAKAAKDSLRQMVRVNSTYTNFIKYLNLNYKPNNCNND